MWSARANVASPLTLQRTLPLPQGTGKFDHFAVDLQANRLFIAATGNHSVEVLDLNTGKVTETLAGLGKPHGLAWIAESNMLYASDGKQADLKIFCRRRRSSRLSPLSSPTMRTTLFTMLPAASSMWAMAAAMQPIPPGLR